MEYNGNKWPLFVHGKKFGVLKKKKRKAEKYRALWWGTDHSLSFWYLETIHFNAIYHIVLVFKSDCLQWQGVKGSASVVDREISVCKALFHNIGTPA